MTFEKKNVSISNISKNIPQLPLKLKKIPLKNIVMEIMKFRYNVYLSEKSI
jgi:hypothetical protein